MLTPSAYQPSHLLGLSTIPNLGVGFILRCFQNLSVPDLATLQCPWQDSRHTSGRFNSVLSSRNSPITRSADYIFILSALNRLGCWRITCMSCRPRQWRDDSSNMQV